MNRTATRKQVAALRQRPHATGTPAARNGAAPGAPDAAPAASVSSKTTAVREANGRGHAQASAQPAAQPAESLEQCVFRSLDQYFADLDGAKPHALHEMVLGAIEKPLLQFALQRCEGNQSAAADLLGINRNTLRRKLMDYGLH